MDNGSMGAMLYAMPGFSWEAFAACLRHELRERDTVFDARGNRLGWLDRFGRPVLEFAPGDYHVGELVEYFDRFGAKLGSLAYTQAAITS
ncbi:MAG: hypothetical protein QM759_10360 [Terricaulis sp.]